MKLMLLSLLFSLRCQAQKGHVSLISPKSNPVPMTKSLAAVWEVMTQFYKQKYPEKSPPAKFYRSVFEIQKAVAKELSTPEGRKRPVQQRVQEVKKFIKIAVNGGSLDFARSLLGKGLYLYIKKKIDQGIPVKDIYEDSALGYLEFIKESIGNVQFDALIARRGDVTLMFVIDTTGSMGDEIASAGAIVKRIIKEVRDYEVDFILSPFNDPGAGPVTYMTHNKREEFLQAVGNLTARGGGDCPELTYEGILEALNAGPRYGSPMFVFTDASAKDNTPTNVISAKVVAQATGTNINFFTHPLACGKRMGGFREIASFTSGQVFPLKKSKEITQFSSFVSNSLHGYTLIGSKSPSNYVPTGAAGRLSVSRIKRDTSNIEYFPFTIDDILDKVIITITVGKSGKAINLVTVENPQKKEIEASEVLSQSKIYEINNPIPGVWKILKPKKVGGLDFIVRGLPKIVLEFGYIFFYRPGDEAPLVPISYPLIGTDVQVIITVAGLESVRSDSLTLDVVDKTDRVIFSNLALQRNPAKSVIFNTTIRGNTKPFKLKLKGKTRRGFSFQRLSSTLVTPKAVHIRFLYSSEEFVLKRGQKTFITLEILKMGAMLSGKARGSSLTFSMKTRLGKASFGTNLGNIGKDITRIVRRRTYIRVFYKTPKEAIYYGKSDTLFVRVTGKQQSEEASASINILII